MIFFNLLHDFILFILLVVVFWCCHCCRILFTFVATYSGASYFFIIIYLNVRWQQQEQQTNKQTSKQPPVAFILFAHSFLHSFTHSLSWLNCLLVCPSVVCVCVCHTFIFTFIQYILISVYHFPYSPSLLLFSLYLPATLEMSFESVAVTFLFLFLSTFILLSF